MSLAEFAARTGHVALALMAVLLVAFIGRTMARLVRQPTVIAEIALGLAIGPILLSLGGEQTLHTVLPAETISWLRFVGHVGLVLFLIGVAHELRRTTASARGRLIGWTTAGSLVIPLLAGCGFAVAVMADPELRGTAPAVALVLLLAVSLAVTAVPVLARILEEQELFDTHVGRLSMTAAMIIDVVAWLLLALAIGLAAGGTGGVPRIAAVFAAGLLLMFCLARLLRSAAVTAFRDRFGRTTAVLVGVVALASSWVFQEQGVTEIFGALLVGLAIPRDGWHGVVRMVTEVGRPLVPVFFVVTGITVFATQFGATPWFAIGLATVLGVVGKVGGGYLGARLGGAPASDAIRVGVLVNTRGLTELVVLQAGYSAGILTAPVFLALVIMALVTTAMTGPVYTLLERSAVRRPKVAALAVEGGR
ncbi:cation:proton antiporter [Kibdelosporangium philippinense]|uniref:Cation:proton antiporter n=1 Tax=Kibdelosporangium philippinense TaxID=211113 RepID=A0ABS8Z613_9PSEU|nr:cation:proton antiporter [Kibdelosporangium philippinense]MCE7002484.1 cation:proton antiporter [Kibdelosporangium philippinense]